MNISFSNHLLFLSLNKNAEPNLCYYLTELVTKDKLLFGFIKNCTHNNSPTRLKIIEYILIKFQKKNCIHP